MRSALILAALPVGALLPACSGCHERAAPGARGGEPPPADRDADAGEQPADDGGGEPDSGEPPDPPVAVEGEIGGVGDRPPVAVVHPQVTVDAGVDVVLDASESFDRDGHELSWTWQVVDGLGDDWSTRGGEDGRLTFSAGTAGDYGVEVTVSANGLSATARSTVHVLPAQVEPLSVSVFLDPERATVGQPVQIRVAVDAEPADVTVLVDRREIPSDGGLATFVADAAGLYAVVAEAEAGPRVGRGSAALLVAGGAPANGRPPTVALTAPADDTLIEGSVAIRGTAEDADLAIWTVEAIHADAGPLDDWFPVLSGRQPVRDDELGRLSGSLLTPGPHRLRVRAVDQEGLEATSGSVRVTVGDSVPLGNLSFSVTDLTLTLSGVPIRIRRTYDSFHRRHGEFGHNWTLDVVGDIRMEASGGPAGEGWEFQGSCVFGGGAVELEPKVFAFWTGRRRYLFRFAPQFEQCLTGGAVFRAHFEPGPGTPGELSFDEEGVLLWLDNGGTDLVYFDDLASPNPRGLFHPRQLTLRTQRGGELDFDDGDLSSVTDGAGNGLTIERDAITHSAGVTVRLRRDDAERVTAVIRPDGLERTYEYSGGGELLASTDFAGRCTRYFYGAAHQLTRVVGPGGDVLFDARYDDAGRVRSALDADGNEVEIEIDDEAGIRRQVSQDGRVTTTHYDEAGNVTRIDKPFGSSKTWDLDDEGRTRAQTDEQGRTVEFEYDADGLASRITGPGGGQTSITRNALGDVTRITSEDGFSATATYHDGELAALQTSGGAEITLGRDAGGLLTSVGGGGATTVQLARDDAGFPTRLTAGGRSVELSTDAMGQVIEMVETDARGREVRTEVEYDPEGKPVALVTAVDGEVVSEQRMPLGAGGRPSGDGKGGRVLYDASGRPSQIIDPDGGVTTREYHPGGLLKATVSPEGRRRGREYDVEARTVTSTSPSGLVTVQHLDEMGRPVRIDHPGGGSSLVEYDDRGRVSARVGPDGSRTTVSYDDEAGARTVTGPDGATVTTTYTPLGRMASVRHGDAPPATFTYDPRGQLTERRSAEGVTARLSWDGGGRLTAVGFEGAGAETRYEHGADGVEVITDGMGRRRTYAYEELGRVVTETLPSGRSQRVIRLDDSGEDQIVRFDGTLIRRLRTSRGLLLSALSGDGVEVSLERDRDGLVTGFSDATGRSTLARDVDGRLLRVVHPDGASVEYGRCDQTGALVRRQSGGGTDRLVHGDHGRLVSVSTAAGVTVTVGYDDAGRPTTWRVGETVTVSRPTAPGGGPSEVRVEAADGQTRLHERYAFDHDLRPVAAEDVIEGVERTWQYDAMGRLVAERSPAGDHELAYDAAANLLVMSGEEERAFEVDEDDRPVRTGGEEYGYDDNGRLVSVSGARDMTLTWDGLDRLVRVQTSGALGSHDIRYAYEADGLLASRTDGADVRRYVWDRDAAPPRIIEERDGEGAVVARTTWLGVLAVRTEAGETVSLHTDPLGSVRLVLDADGEVLDRIRYAPYGEVVEGTGPSLDRPYGFTGEWTDPVTGFVFLRARHYDPSTGRFLSRDQAPPDLQRPVTLNTYLYAGGAPTHLVDPYGTFSLAGMMTSVAIVGRLYAILSNPVLDVFTQLASSLVAYTLGRAALDRSGLFQFIRADPTRLIPRGLLWGVSGAVNFVGAGLVGGTDAILTLWGPYAGTLASYVYGGYTIGGSSVPKVDSWSLYNGIVWDVVTPASYEGHAYSLSAAAPLLLVGMLGWMGDLLLDAFVQGRWNFWGRMATLGVPAVAVAALSLASKDLLARMAQITQMSFAWSSSAGDTTLPPGAGGGAVKTQTWAIAWELAGPNALPRAGGGKFTLYGFSGTWAHCVGTTALFGGPPPPLPGTCMLGP